MNKLSIFKDVADVVVSVGVSGIVGNVIKQTAGTDARLPRRIITGIGGFVLSSMVSDLASKYTARKIDGFSDAASRFLHSADEKDKETGEGISKKEYDEARLAGQKAFLEDIEQTTKKDEDTK